MTSIILQRALVQGWTQRALCEQGPVSLNKFVPGNWIENGTLPSWRMRVLKGAGWELFDYNDERYLMPDPELASFALGTAYGDYCKVLEGRGVAVSAPSKFAGAYNDLIDCILHNDCLEGQMPLASGATLLYPLSFDKIRPRENIERRMRHALWGGWAMVNPITEGRDLFLLPPEAIIKGNKVTLDDAQVSRGVLQQLHKTGLIALRARGFGKSRIAPAVFSLPPRSAKGQTWANFVADQRARWGNAVVTPVVDFKNYSWLSDVPELAAYLQKHHPYVEHFDLLRIEQYLSAWRRTADFDVLEKMIDGIKGIMGEIAARQEIVDEYRSNESMGSVLVVAPQIFSGGDVLERSDAMIVGIDGETAVIEKIWEVTTEDNDAAVEDAMAQHRASVVAYRKGGVIFREIRGRVFKCGMAVLPKVSMETYAAVARGDDKDMEAVLDALRNQLVAMMEMDLVNSRVRNSFVPTIKELQDILRDPKGVERLIGILGAHVSADERIYVRGRVQGGSQVTSLRIIDVKEVGNVAKSYFLLGFDPTDEGYMLREARGRCVLDFALPFVESHLGRSLEAAEKSFLAGILGTIKRSRDKDECLTVKDLIDYLREYGIEPFLEIMSFVGAEIPKGRIYMTGQSSRGNSVVGLRMMGVEEAGKFGKNYFLLGLDSLDEGYVLREARGKGAMDLALPILESNLGRQLDTVEKPFCAGVLGTLKQFSDKDERPTVEDLVAYLGTYGVERFLELMSLAGSEIPEGRFYIIAQVRDGNSVVGLRIVGAEEVGKVGGSCFHLGFDTVDNGYALREASGKGALDLALPLVESNLGRQLQAEEKRFLAGVLGTRKHSYDEGERFTVDDLAYHLLEHGIERFLKLARLLGAEIPEGRLYVTGFVKRGGQVVGLRIVGAEEAGKAGGNYFHLGFDTVDNGYALREARGKGALDLILPFVESNLGRQLQREEKRFLVGVLGTQLRSRDGDECPTVEDLAGYLGTYGVAHFLKIMKFVGAEVPEERIYVTGQQKRGGRVTGIRIIGEGEAEKIGRRNFLLGFYPKDGIYHLDRENIRAFTVLKKALLS